MLWLESRTSVLSVNTSLISLGLCFNWRNTFHTSENNTSVSSVMRRMIPSNSNHSDSVINYAVLYVTKIFKYTVCLAVYIFFSQSWRKMSRNGHTFSFFFIFLFPRQACCFNFYVCMLCQSIEEVWKTSFKKHFKDVL